MTHTRFALFLQGAMLLLASLASPPAQDGASKPSEASNGAKAIFDKKDRDELFKKVRDYLDPMELRAEAREREGTESDKYKAAEKKLKTAEDALRRYLKNTLAKKYKLDSDCLAAVADWQAVISDYIALRADYKKADKTLGTEQKNTLRVEPKNSYTRRIPKNYDPAKKAWPVLLIIQDKGKSSLLATTEDFKSGLLLDGESDTRGHITVAVDLPEAGWETVEAIAENGSAKPEAIRKLHEAIGKPLIDVQSVLRVDPNRVAIAGIGAGTRAAASFLGKYNYRFSAFVAKGGDPGDLRPENLYNIPLYVWGDAPGFEKEIDGADGNKVKWLDHAKAVGLQVEAGQGSADGVALWLAKQARNPYPDRVMAVVKADQMRRACVWFAFEPDPTKEARVDARVDRSQNAIIVSCEGVTRFHLLLSDAVLDLTKPVTIKTNDQERRETLPPTFENLFVKCYQEYFSGSDRGELFTSIPRPIDVPKKKNIPPAESKPASGEKGNR